jgi:hypothetical protein
MEQFTIQVYVNNYVSDRKYNNISSKQVVNVYMAKAPSNVTGWAGDGAVWFKVYQITAVTNGGTSITFPAQSMFMFSILKGCLIS